MLASCHQFNGTCIHLCASTSLLSLQRSADARQRGVFSIHSVSYTSRQVNSTHVTRQLVSSASEWFISQHSPAGTICRRGRRREVWMVPRGLLSLWPCWPRGVCKRQSEKATAAISMSTLLPPPEILKKEGESVCVHLPFYITLVLSNPEWTLKCVTSTSDLETALLLHISSFQVESIRQN